MKRYLASLLLSLSLCFSPVAAAEPAASVAGQMMNAMWEMMDWFFGQRDFGDGVVPWNYANPANPWGRMRPGSPWAYSATPVNPYSPWGRWYGWSSPLNHGVSPWSDAAMAGLDPGPMQDFDGIWRAVSGEFWYVRGNRFMLYNGWEENIGGSFAVQGDVIFTQVPQMGMRKQYRFALLDDLLLLRDVEGRAMLLRKVRGPVTFYY